MTNSHYKNHKFEITIVIPIYSRSNTDLDTLHKCIKSILSKTHNAFNLLLIDDCSQNTRTRPFLENITKGLSNVLILQNKKNLGFPKTVNRGILESGRSDVVILNSDVVVTDNWLVNLSRCAYSDHAFGPVSPLTNRAVFTSFPVTGADNNIPQRISLDHYSHLIHCTSESQYPQILSASGFCMYLKRSLIDEIGLFDEAYGRGYYEDTDLSMRSMEHGYACIADDSTFILHANSASFGEEKYQLSENNKSIFSMRYPFYERIFKSCLTQNTYSKLHNNLSKNISLYHDGEEISKVNTSKPGILFLTHELGGGSERFLNDLTSAIENDFHIYILKSSGSHLTLSGYPSDNTRTIQLEIPVTWQISESNLKYRQTLEFIIDSLLIDAVFINSFIGHSFSAIDIAKSRGIGAAYIFHDFHLICPSIHLADNSNRYCGTCAYGEEREGCLESSDSLNKNGGNATLLNNFRKLVKHSIITDHHVRLIFPSNFSKHLVESIYGALPRDKFDIIPHSLPSIQSTSPTQTKKGKNSRHLNIAIFGNLHFLKGRQEIESVIAACTRKSVRFHFRGVSMRRIRGAHHYGRYKPDEIVPWLKKMNIDVSLLLSNVPETFSYTLSESIAAGIPAIVCDQGAMEERISTTDTGWIVDLNDTASISHLINSIAENRSLLEQKQGNVSSSLNTSNKSNTETYIKLLNDLSQNTSTANRSRTRVFRAEILLDHADHKTSRLNNTIAQIGAYAEQHPLLLQLIRPLWLFSRSVYRYVNSRMSAGIKQ